VQIVFCDDMYTPQAAGVCAQKLLVTDEVLLLAGLDGNEDAAADPVLSAANTISWGDYGSSVAALGDSPTCIINPLETASWIMPQMLPPTPIAIQAEHALEQFIPKSIQLSTVLVPLTATSMQPTCLQVKESGGDTVMLEANPSQAASIVQTCNQLGVTNVLWLTTSVQVEPDLVQTVTKLHVPNLVVMAFS
jgi:hypothetical protein